MNPSPTTGLVERLRAAVTYAYMPMAVRKLLSEAAEALSLPTPTVDREAIENAVHGALVRWSNGEQPKPIKSMVADAIIALIHPINDISEAKP